MKVGQVGVIAAVSVLSVLPSCASNHDASSREVIAITHLSTEPSGTVSVADDSTYSYLSATAKKQTQGMFTAAEFATVNSNAADLGPLYSHSAPDSEACTKAADGYVLISKVGSACFVVSSVSDPDPRATLDFFVTLYGQKAVLP
jgi:hypothetical protein